MARMQEPDEARADAIGEAALVAHLVVEPRAERAAAEDVVDDVGGHEVRIAAGDAATAEHHRGLRHVEIDHDAAAQPLHFDVGDRRQVGLRGQASERAIDKPAGGGRIDVADDAELQRVARKHAAHIAAHVVDGDRRRRFRACRCPSDRRDGLEMPLAQKLRPAMSFGLVLCRCRREIIWRAHALDRGAVEARLGQREPEQVERLVLVLGQRPQGAADIVAGRAQLQLDRLALQPVLEGGGVEIAGAFVERCDRHLGEPGLVGWILRGAAPDREIHRDQRHGRVAHQPEFDAAGAYDALDLGGCGGCREAPPASARQAAPERAAPRIVWRMCFVTSDRPSRPFA